MIPLHQVTILSLLFASMMVLYLIDMWIAIPIGGYPLKIGLANLIIVFALFFFGPKKAWLLIALKIITLAFLVPRHSAFTTLISTSGTVLSFVGMCSAKKILKQNILLTSMIGGILHNLGQWIMILILTQMMLFVYFFPFLVITGGLSGYFIGYVNEMLIPRLNFLKKNIVNK